MIPSAPLLLTSFEIVVILINLALFSYGYPDAARMSLWEEGGVKLFNSDPKKRIYFYANHQEPPEIPYIWSKTSTDFNLGVAVLTFWLLVARLFLKSLKVLNQKTELFLNSCILPCWALCLAAQQSSHLSDDQHLSRTPWYLTHSCTIAHEKNRKSCHVAQASFAMTIVSICFYASLIWCTVANEGIDCILKKYQTKAKVPEFAWPPNINMDNRVSKDIWNDDESPLMQAWDDV